jgi:hypothetical protein
MCALAAGARTIVSGDAAVLAVGSYAGVMVVSAYCPEIHATSNAASGPGQTKTPVTLEESRGPRSRGDWI